jgi:hypothetical protein
LIEKHFITANVIKKPANKKFNKKCFIKIKIKLLKFIGSLDGIY